MKWKKENHFFHCQYGDEEKQKRDFREVHARLVQEEQQLEELCSASDALNMELADHKRLVTGLDQTLEVYSQQVELRRKFYSDVKPEDLPK